MYVLFTCKNESNPMKNEAAIMFTIISSISQWELSVDMETRVLI